MLGGRPLALVVAEAREPGNYRAVWRGLRLYPRWRENLGRYFFARGGYPYRCEVRTPLGVVAPLLWSPHDMLTLNEVFCREDYRAGPDARVVVDVGSNIGISALYFLTRSERARVYAFEPVPSNVARLRENLTGLADRFAVREAAVAERAGRVRFGVEPTGRYGGIGVRTGRTIEVECLDVNDVLAEVLAREGTIDVLKLDTEGAEVATVAAIERAHLARIGTIYLETERAVELHPSLFEASFASQTLALRARRPVAHPR
jgi:FkbM family methyltransferase